MTHPEPGPTPDQPEHPVSPRDRAWRLWSRCASSERMNYQAADREVVFMEAEIRAAEQAAREDERRKIAEDMIRDVDMHRKAARRKTLEEAREWIADEFGDDYADQFQVLIDDEPRAEEEENDA